jgi:hypothetical protein
VNTLLHTEQIAALLDALTDGDTNVRRAALRAVVRLPWDVYAWDELNRLFFPWLEAGEENHDFNQLQVEGLPFWEILEAGAYIPVPKVRSKLIQYRYKPIPPAQQKRLETMLLKAGDEYIISQVCARLDPTRPQDWAGIAPHFYRLRTPPAEIETIKTVAQHADSPILSFWLALALANWYEPYMLQVFFAGLPAPLTYEYQQVFDQATPIFSTYAHPLHPRPVFTVELEDFLADQAKKEPDDPAGELARLLLHNKLPFEAENKRGITADKIQYYLEEIEIDQYYQHLMESGNLIAPSEIELDSLFAIAPGQASRLISLVLSGIWQASRHRGAMLDGMSFSEFVSSARWLGERYQPELDELVKLYVQMNRAPKSQRHGFDEQVAWLISRAELAATLRAINPYLYAISPKERLAAAQVIDRVAWLRSQAEPPGLWGAGGGGGPQEAPFLNDVPPMPIEPPKLMGEKPPKEFTGGSMVELEEIGPFDASGGGAEPVINTEWAPGATPDDPLEPVMPLTCGAEYFFRLYVGLPSVFSTETTPTGLPKDLPVGARLSATLVGYKNSLQIDPLASVGELEVLPGGFAKVHRQPMGENAPQVDDAGITLYFPVRTPAKPGLYKLRCNIYYNELLLQSRLATARVMVTPKPSRAKQPALRTDLDYHLLSPLNAASLNKTIAHKLSLQLNANGDGTHSFHLKGAADGADFKQDDVRFGEGELQGMITQARAVMQKAGWDKPDDWQEGLPFKYQDRALNLNRLAGDLVNLAKWGYEFYTTICDRLAGGYDAIDQFESVMLKTGFVQIAMKSSPSYILPAAIIYDYPLDVGATTPYKLCPQFTTALMQGRNLEDEPCFNGDCPARGDINTVCPSGFWGFRHYLGLPLGLVEHDASLEIKTGAKPRFLMGEYTDFALIKTHKDALDDLSIQFSAEPDRSKLLARLKSERNELLYFYCHGGLVRGAPYLVIGSKENRGLIQSSNFKAFQIRWQDDPRPLVFLNGCHTSAVEPLAALTLLRGFILEARAAGLIGTEITIYEELAGDFAEAFYRRLLKEQPVGKALRGARLAILAQGNPLGLVYTPFVQAGLRLVGPGGAGAPVAAGAAAVPAGGSMAAPIDEDDLMGMSFELPGTD